MSCSTRYRNKSQCKGQSAPNAMDPQTFYSKRPHPLLWYTSRATRGELKIHGIPNGVKYCDFFLLHTKLTHVAVGSIMQPGGPQVEDPGSVVSFNESSTQTTILR